MYARLNLNSGCTLQQLRDDLVALLTGAVTTAAGLTSSNTATSEVVNTVAAEWTFVQHLADTSTRVHFVLSGVDDGGVAKTIGIVMTDTSGSLGFMSWSCGAWNSANKRPAAIDVTDWALASSFAVAADFTEGGAKNGICLHGAAMTPTAIGAFKTGVMQLQVLSAPGATCIYSHFSATHSMLMDIVDIPRDYMPELHPTKWPFLAVNVAAKAQSAAMYNGASGPQIVAASATPGQIGLGYGPSSWPLLTAPMLAELGTGVRYWAAQTQYGGGGASLDLAREAGTIFWYPRKDGVSQYIPRQSVLIPRIATFFSIPPALPVQYFLPGKITPVGSATTVNISYLDEIVAGTDTYVGTGEGTHAIYKG